MIELNEAPDRNTAAHLALKAALDAIRQMGQAVAPLLNPTDFAELEKRMVDGGMLTLIVNNDGRTLTVALAMTGTEPGEQKFLHKLVAPVATVLLPPGSVPIIDPLKMN